MTGDLDRDRDRIDAGGPAEGHPVSGRTDTGAVGPAGAADGDLADIPDEPVEKGAGTVLEQMGGLSGMVASVLPVLVLVPVNARWGLTPAIVSAVVVALAVFVWRLVRRETVQPAVSGLLGVAVCALIAWWVGDAKGYFAYGIWYSLVAGIAFVVSCVVRWPLVGALWHAVNGRGHRWRSNRVAVRAYTWATLAWAVVFFARFAVQQWFYTQDSTGALGVARIVMGVPLTVVVVLISVWAVRRADGAER
ncbi:DUF3159 domain-containing protein [Corynebacterium bovis]|uniref:DUF3159 domain-containing protein n=1 Tax=Corynebacterium bovis TaxID=36808 RepID=UPI002449290E|nr:DUF3159 domain-containing protein [Corynebacterium bovis]MDH2455085.1 DUF3159 domain-containing protein [Corynebacterium bovis]